MQKGPPILIQNLSNKFFIIAFYSLQIAYSFKDKEYIYSKMIKVKLFKHTFFLSQKGGPLCSPELGY